MDRRETKNVWKLYQSEWSRINPSVIVHQIIWFGGGERIRNWEKEKVHLGHPSRTNSIIDRKTWKKSWPIKIQKKKWTRTKIIIKDQQIAIVWSVYSHLFVRHRCEGGWNEKEIETKTQRGSRFVCLHCLRPRHNQTIVTIVDWKWCGRLKLQNKRFDFDVFFFFDVSISHAE